MGETTIRLSKVNPSFLHANSTSHTWAFSAVAELIDNSFDAKAREIQIDQLYLQNNLCLSFQDDGGGMNSEQLYKMLSFGYNDKILSTAIGKYGNGFKSGSMRLGKDAIVFTKRKDTAGIGFLSQTYLEAINADSVLVPMLQYTYPDFSLIDEEAHCDNLAAILGYAPFEDEEKLIKQLRHLPKTGTQIIIYNLNCKFEQNYYELDFDTDPDDIRCPEIYEAGCNYISKYRNSLREYCSILYLRPLMKIKLRENYVKTRLIAKSLSYTEVATYTPKGHKSIDITFGFLPESQRSEDCGMMLYADNRLIKPYEQVSCQKQGKGVGAGVVGVTQAKFLTPIQNKQDFVHDDKYTAAMKNFNTRLKDYWERNHEEASSSRTRACPDTEWIQCDYKKCLKWRHLPQGPDTAKRPDKWYCYMHPDKIDCSYPEDEERETVTSAPPVRRSVSKRKSSDTQSEITSGKHRKQKTSTVTENSVDSDKSSDNEVTPSSPETSQSKTLSSACDTARTVSAKQAASTDKPSTSQSKQTSSAREMPRTLSAMQAASMDTPSISRSELLSSARTLSAKQAASMDTPSTSQSEPTSSARKMPRTFSAKQAASSDTPDTSTNSKRVLRNSSKKLSPIIYDQKTNRTYKSRIKGHMKSKSKQDDSTSAAVDTVERFDDISGISLDNGERTDDNPQGTVDSRDRSGDIGEMSLDDRNRTDDNPQGTVDSGDEVDDEGEMSLDNGDRTNDNPEASVDNGQRKTKNAETSFSNGFGTHDDNTETAANSESEIAESNLIIVKNEEIEQLKDKLRKLENRFNNLLNNNRKLLAKLAPDAPLGDDVDIEQLIDEMVHSGLDE